MGLIMIFGTVLKRETNLPCQGMANKKYLPEWNVKQERFFWGSNPPTFSFFMIGDMLGQWGTVIVPYSYFKEMDMKATVIMEKARDGYYSCFVEEDLPGFGLAGYGDTAESAKEDMMKTYAEIKEMQAEEGKSVPELEFIYKYDMQSFFNYFSFLNVTKVAELAGINASLMRQYTSGVTAAGQKQYDKIRVAVERISKELSAATF